MADMQEDLERLRAQRRRAHEAGDVEAARRFTQRIRERERDPSFGQGVRLPSGETIVSPFPGVDVTFPQDGRPSIDVSGGPLSWGQTARVVGRGVWDAVEGIRSTASSGLRSSPNPVQQAAGQVFERATGELIPEIQVEGGLERAGAAAVQYGVPGLLTGNVIQSATAAAPLAGRVGAQALGAFATDALVTNPENAETLGNWLGGPTRIQPDDPDWLRQVKVGVEGGVATGVLGGIVEGLVSGSRGASRLLSPDNEARGIVREYLNDAYTRGALGGGDAPIDQARSALAELIEARRIYQAQGIDAVREPMRRFVANDIEITVPEYLAARQINLGPVELGRYVRNATEIQTQRAANVRAVSRGAGEVLGTDDPSAAFRASREASQRATGARQSAESSYTELYEQVQRELTDAQRVADEAFADVTNLVAQADEFRAAGNVDGAIRAEREAASRIRNALYGSIDPNGTVFINPVRARDAYSTLLNDVDPADIPGFARIERQYNRILEKGGQASYRDILDLERRVSNLLNNLPEQASSYFDDIKRFRDTIRDGYLEDVARTNPAAREVADQARRFMADEFAPRFRQFGGGDAETRYRNQSQGVSSREVVGDFINRSGSRTEDAGTLNRILMGTELTDEQLSAILRSRDAELPVGSANLRTASPEDYARSMEDVRDVFLGRLAQTIDPQRPSRAQAQAFLRSYGDSIDQFDPMVRREIEAVVNSIGDAENAGRAVQVLQRAADRTEGLADRLTNVTPQTAYQRIQNISRSIRAGNVGISARGEEALQNALDASRTRQAVNQQTLVRYFAQSGSGEQVNPTIALRDIFTSDNPEAALRQVSQELGDNEAIKQGISDYLLNSIVRINDNQSDPRQLVQGIRRLDNWLSNDRNRDALRAVYSRDEIRALRNLQTQMEDMNLFGMSVDNNVFGRSIKDRSLLANIQETLVRISGATEGLSGRVQQRSQIELINSLRNLASGNRSLEDLVNTRLVEITTSPEAALRALEPLSEERQIELAYILLVGGRNAYIQARDAMGEERPTRAQQLSQPGRLQGIR